MPWSSIEDGGSTKVHRHVLVKATERLCEFAEVGKELGAIATLDACTLPPVDPLLLGHHDVAIHRRNRQADDVVEVVRLPALLPLRMLIPPQFEVAEVPEGDASPADDGPI